MLAVGVLAAGIGGVAVARTVGQKGDNQPTITQLVDGPHKDYFAEPGDTVDSIAAKFGEGSNSELADVLEAEKGGPDSDVEPGERFIIPQDLANQEDYQKFQNQDPSF